MRKWMFVCAVVTVAGFLAEPVLGQEPIAAPTTTVITSPAPRGGLFSRRRERRQGMMVVSQPVTVVNQPMAKVETPTPPLAQQGQAVTPMASTEMQVVQPRRGLLARLRNR